MKKSNDFIEMSRESIDAVIQEFLLPYINEVAVITFEGTLGAGKTTFIKRLIKLLGSDEVVTSPTFNYVNSYVVNGRLIQHFDLYRLDSCSDVEEFGFDELIGACGTLSLIEWPLVVDMRLKGLRDEGKAIAIEFQYDPLNFETRLVRIS